MSARSGAARPGSAILSPMPDPTLKERRKLKFTSIDDITTDAGKLSQAERNKKLRQLGNWTLGQACGHIAGWIDFGFDGTPAKFSWLARLLAEVREKSISMEG